MKRAATTVLKAFVFLTIANVNPVTAQAQKSPEAATSSSRTFPNSPQEFVVCTGWHALCSASPDCKVDGDKAICDCLRVNESHVVEIPEIQDALAKRQTEIKCTNAHPCDVDEAPICKAIKAGQYQVGNVKYDWVSTYSYRGWCTLLNQPPIACDPTAPDYTGDSIWAICDVAPCTDNPHPADPERPLSCQCRVKKGAFVGIYGSCTGQKGGIISSMPVSSWDFQNNTYTFAMPGYEFVQGACAPLKSDPW